MRRQRFIPLLVFVLCQCAPATPGPDKQFVGAATGAASGAAAGAVTGFQVGSGTGPGAFVGAGLGAVAGSVRGAMQDTSEESMLDLAARTREQRSIAWAQETLQEQYQRRLELHPTREIYPADLFFFGDSAKLRPDAGALVQELARMNKTRLPWSRLVIASYARGSGSKSGYAFDLAKRRSLELFNRFVHAGIEPRRLEARAVVLDSPLLIDPHDDPLRYNQAVELIAADK